MSKIADDRLVEAADRLVFHGQPRGAHAVRIGDGATVPVSYLQERARGLFADALYRLVPETSACLASDDVLDVADRLYPAVPYSDSPLDTVTATNQAMVTDGGFDSSQEHAFAQLEAMIDAWQHHFQLSDSWIHLSAWRAVAFGLAYRRSGRRYNGGLPLDDIRVGLHDGKQDTVLQEWERRSFPEPHRLISTPVFLDALKYPDSADFDEYWESGEFGTFDPNSETVDAGAKRLMPELEKRLRRALESMADQDRVLNHAQKPKAYKTVQAFEWLVRFQVLEESFSQIAKSADTDYRNVGRQVKEAASIIGLTPRPRDLGGRPEKAVP
jgi:hypothetical protein